LSCELVLPTIVPLLSTCLTAQLHSRATVISSLGSPISRRDGTTCLDSPNFSSPSPLTAAWSGRPACSNYGSVGLAPCVCAPVPTHSVALYRTFTHMQVEALGSESKKKAGKFVSGFGLRPPPVGHYAPYVHGCVLGVQTRWWPQSSCR